MVPVIRNDRAPLRRYAGRSSGQCVFGANTSMSMAPNVIIATREARDSLSVVLASREAGNPLWCWSYHRARSAALTLSRERLCTSGTPMSRWNKRRWWNAPLRIPPGSVGRPGLEYTRGPRYGLESRRRPSGRGGSSRGSPISVGCSIPRDAQACDRGGQASAPRARRHRGIDGSNDLDRRRSATCLCRARGGCGRYRERSPGGALAMPDGDRGSFDLAQRRRA